MKRIGFSCIVLLALTCVPAVAQNVSKDRKVELKGALQKKSLGVKALVDLSGTWWRTPSYVRLFGLTPEQQQKMDDVFQESRVRLIPLDGDLKVQEALLEPLMAAERLDEAKITAQIDRVAQARAELEKANARMLLGLRQVMTVEQWAKIRPVPMNSKTNLKKNKAF